MFEQFLEMFEGVLSSAEFWDIVSLVALGVLAITAVAIAVPMLKSRTAGISTPRRFPVKTSKIRHVFPGSNAEPGSEAKIATKEAVQKQGSEIEILDLEPEPELGMAEKDGEPVGESVDDEIITRVIKPEKLSEKPSRPIIGSLSKDGKISFGDRTLVQLTLPFGSVSIEGSTEITREIVDKVLAKAESRKEWRKE